MKKWLVSGIIITILFPIMILFFLFSSAGGSSTGGGSVTPVTPTATQAEFVAALVDSAKKTQSKYGVFASVTLGQAILESGWGRSGLTAKSNNLFGIKAYNWSGPTVEMKTTEEVNGGTIWVMATWRAYNSWDESVMDHGKFLKENSRYTSAGTFKATNYKEQVEALKRAGYATESDYVSLVCGVIESYNLNQYD